MSVAMELKLICSYGAFHDAMHIRYGKWARRAALPLRPPAKVVYTHPRGAPIGSRGFSGVF
jgi:hypothetical protein